MAEIEEALAEAQAWMDEPGVDAIGEGELDGEPTIDVWVRPEELRRAFPEELHGVRVRVLPSGGPVQALS